MSTNTFLEGSLVTSSSGQAFDVGVLLKWGPLCHVHWFIYDGASFEVIDACDPGVLAPASPVQVARAAALLKVCMVASGPTDICAGCDLSCFSALDVSGMPRGYEILGRLRASLRGCPK